MPQVISINLFATYLSTYFSISYDFTNFSLDQLQLKIEIKDDTNPKIKKEQPEPEQQSPDEESEPETKKIKTPEDDDNEDDEVEEIKKNED